MKPSESFTIYGLNCIAYKNEAKQTVSVKTIEKGFYYEFNECEIWINTKHLIGLSKTHPNDKFKYHIGVTIATNKLLKQINKAILNKINDLAKQVQPFTEFVDNHTIKTRKITK